MKLRPYQEKAINEAWVALKQDDSPVLFEMSVGGGKSVCIATIAKEMNDTGKKVLCLVHTSELVRNNSEAYKMVGGNPSVFCFSVNKVKNFSNNIVFSTPQSISVSIKNDDDIAKTKFNMIIVDECHAINFSQDMSNYMRILRHYKNMYEPMRVLGFTGTPFRGNESLVGVHAFFKTKVANISTTYLMDNGYLVRPILDKYTIDGIDFSQVSVTKQGSFNTKVIEKIATKDKRLTFKILQDVQKYMSTRNLCLIFCTSLAHCNEVVNGLPINSSRIISSITNGDNRDKYLTEAREGKIQYLISVNCLLTGINVPRIDCIAWLRPTESLLLFIQGIGRGLRLHESKTNCLVLDYAGNVDRFQDFDNPIINEAIKPKPEDEPQYVIPCISCKCLNKLLARRCRNVINGNRCGHFFEWKACTGCGAQNDISTRNCKECGTEMIDPNAKLSLDGQHVLLDVYEASYFIRPSMWDEGSPVFYARYRTHEGYIVSESFGVRTDVAKNIFYAKFIKQCVTSPSKYYESMKSFDGLQEMIDSRDINVPHQLQCKISNKHYKINKRIFWNE